MLVVEGTQYLLLNLGVTVHDVIFFWPPVIKISLSSWSGVCCQTYNLVEQKFVKG
jgi:hypothetical protein